MSDPSAGPPSVPASPAVAEPAAYRPLSLLAVVGLGLAGAYAAVVVLGGLVALLQGNPWLMPFWTILFPIAAAVLSLLGLLRVQRSEGTLAGEKAATWGLLLSALVGLSYWAYVGATYFAITREASKAGQDYLDKLAAGDVEGAFRLTLPPAERPPEGAGLREQLEKRFNNVGEKGIKGPFGGYRQSDPIRLLSLDGRAATAESVGVEKWEYIGGGYQVQLLYRVNRPETTCTMVVTVVGTEPKGSGGRQWHVVADQSGLPQGQKPQITEEGRALFRAADVAREYYTKDWLEALRTGRPEEAFLGTLPPAERAPLRQSIDGRRVALVLADALGAGALPCAAPAAALARAGLIADPGAAREASLPGFHGFVTGDLVRAEAGTFWAPEDLRETIVRLTRAQFGRPGDQLAAALAVDSGMGAARFPFLQRDGDLQTFGFDLMLPLSADASASPSYLVECRVTVECDAAEAAAGVPKAWRFRSLDLVSGKPLPPGIPMSAFGRRMMGP
jgi:hypothetical protein